MRMAQLLVRNIEQSVKARLQRRAKRNGRSMEEEVREILRNAVNEPEPPKVGLGTEIASLFKGTGLRFEVKEMRGHPVRPVSFDEE
jgi:plasmid stability protein